MGWKTKMKVIKTAQMMVTSINSACMASAMACSESL